MFAYSNYNSFRSNADEHGHINRHLNGNADDNADGNADGNADDNADDNADIYSNLYRYLNHNQYTYKDTNFYGNDNTLRDWPG